MTKIRIHYRRLPDSLTVYQQHLVRDGTDVKVTLATDLDFELQIHGALALEPGSSAVWFTVPGAWWDLGRFHRADGTFTGFYANVITPCVFDAGGDWWTTDLFLDVWWPASRSGPGAHDLENARLLDEDELAEALRREHISSDLASRARRQARALMEQPSPARRFSWARSWTLEAAADALYSSASSTRWAAQSRSRST